METKDGGRDPVVFVPGIARPTVVESCENRRHRGTLASALARTVDAEDPHTACVDALLSGLGVAPDAAAAPRLASG